MADKKYTNRELLDYNFNENDYESVSLAKQTAADAAAKYKGIGDWQYGDEDAWSKAKDALTNRKAFSYDLNADALYQQYKDQYITQGKQAMQDAMGQAAAMTGGYASSYAATVGNQAYQGYLQGLNDKVPELYQLAMQRYNMEGDQLRTAYDVLNSDRESDYGRFTDKKNTAFNEMDYYNTLYDAAYNREQTNYNNNLNINNENYWNEYNAGYKAEQDQIANDLARDQLRLQKSQLSGNTGKVDTSQIDDSIYEKAEGMENDILRANYLSGLVTSGVLTEEQKNAVLAQTIANDTTEYDGGRYYMVDNGGVNGFLGMGKWFGNIDDNAKVMDEDGNTYTMKQLYNQKISEGMSDADAKKWVVGLQKKIGAH